MAQKTEKNSTTLKITLQSRERTGMVYDLRGDGNKLRLTVAPRARPEDEGEWHIEARSAGGPREPALVSEWGGTRAEALRAVGRAWDEKAPVEGLAAFDWDAVAQLLAAVRAI